MRIVQHPRFSTAGCMAYTGPISQLIYDTDLNQFRLQDGVTPGGILMPKLTDIPAATLYKFLAVNTKSVPATPMTVADGYDFNEFTVAGAYTLMAASVFNVGQGFIATARIAGVSLVRAGTDLIEDKGVTTTSLNLTLNEQVTIVRKSAGLFMVTERY